MNIEAMFVLTLFLGVVSLILSMRSYIEVDRLKRKFSDLQSSYSRDLQHGTSH